MSQKHQRRFCDAAGKPTIIYYYANGSTMAVLLK